MHKQKLILLIILGVSLLSCKKGKADFTIKGTINDNTFGVNLTNCSIKLYEVEAGGSKTNLIGTATSSDGTYSFTFPRNAAESYILQVDKNNYFSLNESILFSSLTVEEDNTRNFSTTAKAWAALHFVNQAPNAVTDKVLFTKQLGKTNCSECCPSEQQSVDGIVDTIIYCINDGNTVYSYLYFDEANGVSGTKSAVTVAFDTTEILYTY